MRFAMSVILKVGKSFRLIGLLHYHKPSCWMTGLLEAYLRITSVYIKNFSYFDRRISELQADNRLRIGLARIR